MALGDYLASLNLSPGVASKLASYTEPNQSTAPDEFAPPTPEEIKRYSAMAQTIGPPTADEALRAKADDPRAIAAAQAYNNSTGPGRTNPTRDPNWTPEGDTRRAKEGAQQRALANAPPQGPEDDGFPNYRNLDADVQDGKAAPPAPMQVVPAHWQPGTRSYSRQLGMDPSELQEGQEYRFDAYVDRRLGAEKHLEAAQKQAEADVAYAEAHKVATDQAAARLERLQEERKAYVAREQMRMEELAQAANQKVDPEAAKGSSAAQLFAAIGVALGTFGSSITGGPNTAYEIVKNNIDRNIRAQEVNIANAKSALSARQNLYAQNLAEFGDKERAILATKVAMLDQAKAIADQQYAKAKGTANEAAYFNLQGNLKDDRAQAVDRFNQLTHTQIVEQGNEHYVPTTVVGGGGGGGEAGKDELYVPGLGGYARTKDEAIALRQRAALREQIAENYRQMHKIMEEGKSLSSATSPLQVDKLESKLTRLKGDTLLKVAQYDKLGALSGGDTIQANAKAALNAVGVQGRLNNRIAQGQEMLADATTQILRDQRMDSEHAGIQLGREEYRRGRTGSLEPRRVLTGRNKTITKETESYDDLVANPKGTAKR